MDFAKQVMGERPEWDKEARLIREVAHSLVDPGGGWTHLVNTDDETDAVLEALVSMGTLEVAKEIVEGRWQVVLYRLANGGVMN